MWNKKPSFRFEIDNFSKKEAVCASQIFVSGGCEWYLNVYPKGNSFAANQLPLYLYVANTESLEAGWKRKAGFYFVLLNQSDKEIYRTPVASAANNLFCADVIGRYLAKNLPLSKLQEKGALENDKLIIEVYINVVEATDGEDVSKNKETVEINGFWVLASQVTSVRKIFAEHPDIAQDFKSKNQMVKTAYMNVLLNLIETLEKPLKNISETELSNAQIELCELIEQGFKLDWLKSKLEEVSLEKKKGEDPDGSRVQKLEERFKNLELMGLGRLKSKLEEVSLEMKKTDDADRSRVQQLEERFKNLERMMKKSEDVYGSRVQQIEERIKNLELMESGIKVDCLKSKLEDVSLEMKKAEADGSLVQNIEERVKNLELMELEFTLECLNSKFVEDSLERNQSHDADVQKHEERIKNLEQLVSYHKVELDKKKAKSCADGFLLVDEVA